MLERGGGGGKRSERRKKRERDVGEGGRGRGGRVSLTMYCVTVLYSVQCLLVQGYPASTSWGFPKGKLERGESDMDCAIREVGPLMFNEGGGGGINYMCINMRVSPPWFSVQLVVCVTSFVISLVTKAWRVYI